MRIEVNTTGNHTYYLNFDLIVEFSFNNKEDGYFILSYTSETGPEYWEKIKI